MDFTGKTILVTGAASGIGKATALRFAALGAAVALADLNSADGTALARQINTTGGKAFFFSSDITREENVKNLVDDVLGKFGQLDFAYNNAGIGGDFARVADYPTDDWDKVMAINLRAVFLCMKYEIPAILKGGKGAIVNCASVLTQVAYECDSAYVASKFGVLGLTKNAALEYASTGLRINSISPGFTRTPMIDKGDEGKLEKIAARHPIGRLANPEEMAEGVAWLCSDHASFAIGLNLLLDGGYTLQ